LLAAPLNLLNREQAGDDWAIRLSGDVLTQQLLDRLTAGVTPPPAGTIVEDSPTAGWTWDDGTWLATGSVGLQKPDACPGLFGDVNISVTVNVAMEFIPDTSATPPVLNYRIHISSDVSDWDSFRCWLGNGGIASVLLGAITGPIVGAVGGIVALIAVGETVRLDAGRDVLHVPPGGSLRLVNSDSTSATYMGSMPLPSLASSGSGTLSDAKVNEFGVLVTGTIFYLPAQHTVTFNPSEGTLPSHLIRSFSCKSHSWEHGVNVQTIEISDRANVFSVDLGLVPVTVFPSTVSTPDTLWSIQSLAPTGLQSVQVVGSSAVTAGDNGRIYLHTSAGIRRYDIPVLADLPPLTPEDQIKGLAACLRNTKIFSMKERIKWLVDPPPFDYGYPAVRQWLVVFSSIPAGTQVTIHLYREQVPYAEPISLVAAEAGESAFEFVTEPATELVIEHTNREGGLQGRVSQRWLMPIQTIAVGGAPTSLLRSGKTIGVATRSGFVSLDTESGLISRNVGDVDLVHAGALPVTERKPALVGSDTAEGRPVEAGVTTVHESTGTVLGNIRSYPFSLTLPGGKIAAAHGDNLLIAIPWGAAETLSYTAVQK
jgi:hypothetical protein